jgi:hypothetical protein
MSDNPEDDGLAQAGSAVESDAELKALTLANIGFQKPKLKDQLRAHDSLHIFSEKSARKFAKKLKTECGLYGLKELHTHWKKWVKNDNKLPHNPDAPSPSDEELSAWIKTVAASEVDSLEGKSAHLRGHTGLLGSMLMLPLLPYPDFWKDATRPFNMLRGISDQLYGYFWRERITSIMKTTVWMDPSCFPRLLRAWWVCAALNQHRTAAHPIALFVCRLQYCPDARAVWPSKRAGGAAVPDPQFVSSLYAFSVGAAAEFLKSEDKDKDVLRQDGGQEAPVARLVHWYVPIPFGSGSS